MEYIEIFFGTILRLFYSLINNYGVSIILFTLLIKLALFPLDLKQRKSMARMQKVQPVLNQLQKKYANDKEKLNQEIMKVYKEYKVSPTSGCLPMIVQLPIIFALYWVIRQPITYMMGIREVADQALIIVNFNDWAVGNKDMLVGGLKTLFENGDAVTGNNYAMYEIQIAQLINQSEALREFVGPTALANGLGSIESLKLQTVDFTFLGLNLADTPQLGKLWEIIKGNTAAVTAQDIGLLAIPVLSGVSSWFSSRLSQQKPDKEKVDKNRVVPENEKQPENTQASTMKTMTIMMPLVSASFCFQFPAALGLYWIISNVIQLIQLVVVNKLVLPRMENDLIKGEIIDVKENRKKRKKH